MKKTLLLSKLWGGRMKSKKLLLLLLVLSVAWLSQTVSAQSVVFDDSDGPFSILAQMVTVLSPNGDENWNGSEPHDITWSLDASITNVNIDYSIDSGNNWTPVASNIANSNSLSRNVPFRARRIAEMRNNLFLD
jgi:hypothetical protein